jgi:lipopolysaccharide export system protein LptA
LIAHYTKDQEVTRIECLGNVEVFDGDKWAKGERADFDNITGVLEVTGSPEAKQGKNHVKGTKVIFYKEKDTIKVENATTVFESTSQTASESSKPGSKAPQPKPEPKKGKP